MIRNKKIKLFLSILILIISIISLSGFFFKNNEIFIKDKISKIKLPVIYTHLEYFLGKEKSIRDKNDPIIFNGPSDFELFGKKYSAKNFSNIHQILYGISLETPGSLYLDLYDNNLFLISSTGTLAYSNDNDFKNSRLVFNQIKTNIDEYLKDKHMIKNRWFSIKDLLIDNGLIFVSYTEEISKNCWGTSIIYSKLNLSNIKFEKLFTPKICINEKNPDKEFVAHQSGGRMVSFLKDQILFSIGDYRYRKHAQDLDSPFGKILSINYKNKKSQIISIGNRNPQGMLYDKEKDFILFTEHGPKGGDEININVNPLKNVKNYGWPKSSYGEHYQNVNDVYKKYPLLKSHKNYGFEEPLKFFKNSVALSEIVALKRNAFLCTSLRDRSIYTFELDKDFKIVNFKRFFFNERIRDVLYDEKNDRLIFYLEETATISVIQLNEK